MSDSFLQFAESEKELYLYIIDTLAHEYGWSIEYIQNLQLPAIVGLIKVIRKRKDMEDKIAQMNISRAISGKLGSNYVNKPSKTELREVGKKEIENLKRLSEMLNIPIKDVKDDK